MKRQPTPVEILKRAVLQLQGYTNPEIENRERERQAIKEFQQGKNPPAPVQSPAEQPKHAERIFRRNDLCIKAREELRVIKSIRIACVALYPIGFILALATFKSEPTSFDRFLVAAVVPAFPLGLVLLGLYFYAAQRRQLMCHSCEKFLDSKRFWICACCDNKNMDVRAHPFTEKCNYCGEPPSGIQCPHCGEINAFQEEANPGRIAKFQGAPAFKKPEAPKPNIDNWRKEQIAEIEFKIDLTRMSTELANAEQAWRAVQEDGKREKQSIRGKLEKSAGEYWDRNMALHDIAEKRIAKVKADFPDDPAKHERAKSVFQSWAMEMLREGDGKK